MQEEKLKKQCLVIIWPGGKKKRRGKGEIPQKKQALNPKLEAHEQKLLVCLFVQKRKGSFLGGQMACVFYILYLKPATIAYTF